MVEQRKSGIGRRPRASKTTRFGVRLAPALLDQIKKRASDLGLDVNQYVAAIAKADIQEGSELSLIPASLQHSKPLPERPTDVLIKEAMARVGIKPLYPRMRELNGVEQKQDVEQHLKPEEVVITRNHLATLLARATGHSKKLMCRGNTWSTWVILRSEDLDLLKQKARQVAKRFAVSA